MDVKWLVLLSIRNGTLVYRCICWMRQVCRLIAKMTILTSRLSWRPHQIQSFHDLLLVIALSPWCLHLSWGKYFQKKGLMRPNWVWLGYKGSKYWCTQQKLLLLPPERAWVETKCLATSDVWCFLLVSIIVIFKAVIHVQTVTSNLNSYYFIIN